MNSKKIIGNLGIAELALLALGGGAAGYFLVKNSLAAAVYIGSITVIVGSLVELFATGVQVGSNNMLPNGSATIAGAQ